MKAVLFELKGVSFVFDTPTFALISNMASTYRYVLTSRTTHLQHTQWKQTRQRPRVCRHRQFTRPVPCPVCRVTDRTMNKAHSHIHPSLHENPISFSQLSISDMATQVSTPSPLGKKRKQSHTWPHMTKWRLKTPKWLKRIMVMTNFLFSPLRFVLTGFDCICRLHSCSTSLA